MPSDNHNNSASSSSDIRTLPQDVDPSRFPRAIAARIGDRELWIANKGAVKPDNLSAMDLSPEFVVSLNQTPTAATTHHHPLKDGYVNDQRQFISAVETTREALRSDGSVIVNCAAGISRSTTVIATAIAAEEERSFDPVVEEVRQTRERAQPHPKLQLNAQGYLSIVVDQLEASSQFKQLVEDLSLVGEEKEMVDALLAAQTE